MKLIHFLYITLCLSSIIACSENCPTCDNPPESINFSFVTPEGSDILYSAGSKVENLNIVYEERGVVYPVNHSFLKDDIKKRAYIQSGDISYLCHKGINNYAVVNGTDTISHLDIIFTQKSDPDRCCTWYSAESVYADGIPINMVANERFGGITIQTIIP